VFFDENSRLKIDYEQGLVRLSLKSSDYSVDEFTISFSDFDSFYESATSHKDYESDNIKIKWLSRDAIVQIRESVYKRRIFKFSEPKINRILSQFGAEKIGYMHWLSTNETKAHEVTDEYIYKKEDSDENDNKGEILARKLENKIDKVIDICIQLSESVSNLSTKMKDLERKTQNVVTTSSSVSNQESDFSFGDDEHFIPSDLNVNLKGTMTSESTSSDESAMDAAEALKKLRRSK